MNYNWETFLQEQLAHPIEKYPYNDNEVLGAQIVVVQTFKNLLSNLSKNEYRKLKENIKVHGCHSPIIVWVIDNLFIVIDGHHRLKACTELNYSDYKIHKIPFKSLSDAIDYVFDEHEGRRNISPRKLKRLIAKHYKAIKHYIGFNQHSKKNETNQANEITERTIEKLAKTYKISPKSVQRAIELDDALERIDQILPNENILEDIYNDNIKSTEKDVKTLSEMEKEDVVKIISEVRRHPNKTLNKTIHEHKINKNIKHYSNMPNIKDHVMLHENDFYSEIDKIPNASVDLIISTSVNEAREAESNLKFKESFRDFSKNIITKMFEKVRSNGRVLILCPQWTFLEVIDLVHTMNIVSRGFHLKQIIVWHHPNKTAIVRDFKSQTRFPQHDDRLLKNTYTHILHFVNTSSETPNINKKDFIDNKYFKDVWEIPYPTNQEEVVYHKNQYPKKLVNTMLELFTVEGDTVFNPFAGADYGSVGVACALLNRKCILIEKDPEKIRIIKSRLNTIYSYMESSDINESIDDDKVNEVTAKNSIFNTDDSTALSINSEENKSNTDYNTENCSDAEGSHSSTTEESRGEIEQPKDDETSFSDFELGIELDREESYSQIDPNEIDYKPKVSIEE